MSAPGAGGAAEVEVPTEAMRAYFGLAWAPIQHFAQMLTDEGELRGLIGPRELPRLWGRHLVNSAAVAPFLNEAAAVADVGFGAGFPGLVLAIVRPDLELHLVEPMERRIAWLSDVVEEIGLDNVTLHHARAEQLHRQRSFDYVTARAVAAMDKLERWTVPIPEAPNGLAIIGWDESRGTYLQHYFDDRAIARVYEMRFEDGVWTLERTKGDFSTFDFSQRFRGTLNSDGNRIDGTWEIAEDHATWTKDFDLIYSRIGR